MIKIGKDISSFSTYSCQPKTRREFIKTIKDRISKYGTKCDLNDIDTSLITDMSYLFCESKFNGDISKWNVSNVKNMSGMFYRAIFNRDISKWDVSNVTDMSEMFVYSNFNGDFSKWDVSNVKDMGFMFKDARFDRDISNWKINKNCATFDMFLNCAIEEEHKPNVLR